MKSDEDLLNGIALRDAREMEEPKVGLVGSLRNGTHASHARNRYRVKFEEQTICDNLEVTAGKFSDGRHRVKITCVKSTQTMSPDETDMFATESQTVQTLPGDSSRTTTTCSKTSSPPTVLKKYLVALRPWSLSASLTPVSLGSVLAYKTGADFNISVFFITCLTALSVHAAGNLVNTYFDYCKGVDSKKSDDRTLVDHLLHPSDVARLGAFFYVAGCVCFILQACVSTAKFEHLALLYFGGLSSSFLYTGGLGLKYIALGDIAILLSFGPLTVMFSFLTQTGSLSAVPLLYAIPLALNTEAILHANNTRDVENDRHAGIVTLAILLGPMLSYILFVLLIFVPYIIFVLMGVHCSTWMFLPVFSIFKAFKAEKFFREKKMQCLPQNVAKLNLILGFLYVISCYGSPIGSLPYL